MKTLKLTLACMAATSFLAVAQAAELPAGTVINKETLDRIKNDTFEGKTIGSMLPEKVEVLIRDWGLTIKLRKSEPIVLDPKMIEATKKYAGTAKYDTTTNEVSGYKAGVPFPDVAPSDPNYAAKLVWNVYYGRPVGQVLDLFKSNYLLIDGDKGLERTQQLSVLRYYMKNRISGKNTPVDGDGTVFTKSLLYFTYPQDIKGVGTFTIRYDGPQFEDNWVYVKSARRTRRLPGGAWMDPIGGTDQLNDDFDIFNARPSWYKSFKYLGDRWILTVAHQSNPIDLSKKGTPDEWPTVDLKHAPYWNPLDAWEPRQVHVIEAVGPSEHPYSKKILYIDVGYEYIHMGEAYDKKGEFWKWFFFPGRPVKGEDGVQTFISGQGHTIDLKRRHATIFVNAPDVKTNTNLTADDVTLGKLEAAGQ